MKDKLKDLALSTISARLIAGLTEQLASFQRALGEHGRELVELSGRVADIISLQGEAAACRRAVEADAGRIDLIDEKLDRISGVIDGLYRRHEIMESAARQQELLSHAHYEAHVIRPLAQRLISLLDVAQSLEKGPGSSSGSGPSLVEAVTAQLLEALAQFGVQLISCKVGDAFDGRTMQMLKQTTASRPERDGTVAARLRLGFRFGNHVVRPSGVQLFSFQNHDARTLARKDRQGHAIQPTCG